MNGQMISCVFFYIIFLPVEHFFNPFLVFSLSCRLISISILNLFRSFGLFFPKAKKNPLEYAQQRKI